jgi:hypothetical protein
MDYPFVIPGSIGPQLVVSRSDLGSVGLKAAGVALKRTGRKGNVFAVPMPDGTCEEVVIEGLWTGLAVRTRGQTIQLERRLATWELALTFAPFILLLGGAVGGAVGAMGWLASSQAIRRVESPALRAAVGIAIAAASIVVYVLVSDPIARLIRTIL